jgi:hypothetical protein
VNSKTVNVGGRVDLLRGKREGEGSELEAGGNVVLCMYHKFAKNIIILGTVSVC